MDKKYNLKYLISIALHTQAPQIYYELRTWKQGWPWHRKTIHGVKATTAFCDKYNNINDFLTDHPNYVIYDNNIYQKPYVYMEFVDDNYTKLYFDTKEEATEYYNNVLKKIENKI